MEKKSRSRRRGEEADSETDLFLHPSFIHQRRGRLVFLPLPFFFLFISLYTSRLSLSSHFSLSISFPLLSFFSLSFLSPFRSFLFISYLLLPSTVFSRFYLCLYRLIPHYLFPPLPVLPSFPLLISSFSSHRSLPPFISSFPPFLLFLSSSSFSPSSTFLISPLFASIPPHSLFFLFSTSFYFHSFLPLFFYPSSSPCLHSIPIPFLRSSLLFHSSFSIPSFLLLPLSLSFLFPLLSFISSFLLFLILFPSMSLFPSSSSLHF